MKTMNAALAAYLQSKPNNVIAVDCFTFALNNGTIVRVNNSDLPVVIYRASDPASAVLDLGVLNTMKLGQVTTLTPDIFVANSIRVQGLTASQKIGLDVDEQSITVYSLTPETYLQSASAAASGLLNSGQLGSMVLDSGPYTEPGFGPTPELIDGVPFLWAVRQHLFDWCWITRETAFLPGWGQPAIGSVVRFYGLMAEVEKVGRTTAQFKVKSAPVLLDTPFPRNIYQASCRHTHYDAGCGLSKAAYAESGTVHAGTTATNVIWTNPLTPVGIFAQGSITFTTGALSGDSFTIRSSTSTSLAMMTPLPVIPQVGDTFTAYPGCDHTCGQDTSGNAISGNQGCAYYNNVLAHFLGFPRVPPPTTAL